jgi:hypothetical protein
MRLARQHQLERPLAGDPFQPLDVGLQDYCPRCKRIMRGLAYSNLPQTSEPVFKGSRLTTSEKETVTAAKDQ